MDKVSTIIYSLCCFVGCFLYLVSMMMDGLFGVRMWEIGYRIYMKIEEVLSKIMKM